MTAATRSEPRHPKRAETRNMRVVLWGVSAAEYGEGPARCWAFEARRSWRCELGVAELALGGLEYAGAVLVRALVFADLLGALVVALGEHGLDLGGRELVVA